MLYRSTSLAPVFGLRREIDRLFEDTFGGRAAAGGAADWTPAVDIREDARELSMDLELPGINPDQVDISVDNGVLTVRGTRNGERQEQDEEARYHLVERSYGSFTRSFQLPPGVDEQQISANFDRGVLHVRIPKAALPQPRKIQIGGSGQQQVQGGSGTQGQGQQRGERSAASNTDRGGSGSKAQHGEGSQREPMPASDSGQSSKQ